LTRKGKHGIVYIAIYVDDCLCCGNAKEIEAVIENMKHSGFKLKVEKSLLITLAANCISQRMEIKGRLDNHI